MHHLRESEEVAQLFGQMRLNKPKIVYEGDYIRDFKVLAGPQARLTAIPGPDAPPPAFQGDPACRVRPTFLHPRIPANAANQRGQMASQTPPSLEQERAIARPFMSAVAESRFRDQLEEIKERLAMDETVRPKLVVRFGQELVGPNRARGGGGGGGGRGRGRFGSGSAGAGRFGFGPPTTTPGANLSDLSPSDLEEALRENRIAGTLATDLLSVYDGVMSKAQARFSQRRRFLSSAADYGTGTVHVGGTEVAFGKVTTNTLAVFLRSSQTSDIKRDFKVKFRRALPSQPLMRPVEEVKTPTVRHATVDLIRPQKASDLRIALTTCNKREPSDWDNRMMAAVRLGTGDLAPDSLGAEERPMFGVTLDTSGAARDYYIDTVRRKEVTKFVFEDGLVVKLERATVWEREKGELVYREQHISEVTLKVRSALMPGSPSGVDGVLGQLQALIIELLGWATDV